MSPSEFDLRAALREGEGDGVSADRVVIAAQRRRAQRRTRLLTTAASVVVVAAIGGGITAIARSGGSDQSGASNGGARAAGIAPTPAAGREFGYSTPCPAFPNYKLPGGGSPGQFGSGGPLFSKPVARVLVCSYGSATPAASTPTGPGALELSGAQAAELARSLENASKTPTSATCVANSRALVIVGYAADGNTVGTVTVTSRGCGLKITNGTAVRYDWQIPSDLQPKVVGLQPTAAVSQASVPPGIMHGSPVAS